MSKVGLFCIVAFVAISSMSCGRSNRVMRTDTTTSGYAEIAADDCYSPILDEEINVFEATHEGASIIPFYSGEVETINLLLKDSVRLIVTARDLTEAEKQGLKDKKLQVRSQKIAIDGIALIINKQNTDSLINVSTIKKIMTGEIDSWKQINSQSRYDKMTVVFDNPNSSTVRFIKDSINRGEPLSEKLKAQNSNKEVMDFVANTPNAIGVIGVNWISNPNDSTNLSFTDKVRVMAVSNSATPTPSNSFLPFAGYLAVGEYPLTRDMYVILTDLRGTLQAGFVSFLVGDIGQRIILKAGLVPATRPTRLLVVRDEF